MKNLRRILLGTVLLLSVAILKSFAQAPEWEWAKSAGGVVDETINSVATDPYGNIYITGSFESNTLILGKDTLKRKGQFYSDFYLAKYDPNGNAIWAKSASSQGKDEGRGIAIDSSGNVYVLGNFGELFGSPITFDSTSLYNPGMFLVKYDPHGNVLWAKAKDSLNSVLIGNAIAIDNNGHIVMTGYFNSSKVSIGSTVLTSEGWADFFIAKYDPQGNVLWAKSTGGLLYEQGIGITTDNNGNIFVTGEFQSSSISFDNIKLFNKSDSFDVFIVKYDSDGKVEWAHSGGGNLNDHVIGVTTDYLGNLYVTGNFASSTLTFNNLALPSKIAIYAQDIYLVKFDGNGNALWGKLGRSETVNIVRGIVASKNGDISITGAFTTGKLSFDDTVLYHYEGKVTYGVEDIFVVNFDANGKVLWAMAPGTENSEEATCITVDNNGMVILTGYFRQFTVLGDFTLTNFKNRSTYKDVFIAKLNIRNASFVEEANLDNYTSISPNPTTGGLHISLPAPGNWTITIYTLDGQSVFKKEVTQADATIDLSGKAKGVYVYRLLKDGEVFKSGKLVLE